MEDFIELTVELTGDSMIDDRLIDADPAWIESQEKATRETNLELDIIALAESHGVSLSKVARLAEHIRDWERRYQMRAEDGEGPNCIDCGVITRGGHYADMEEYYNVHNDVWAQAGLGPKDGLLCIGCLEGRIGRKLNKDDFGYCQINIHPGYLRSERFQDRLTRSPDEQQSEVAVP